MSMRDELLRLRLRGSPACIVYRYHRLCATSGLSHSGRCAGVQVSIVTIGETRIPLRQQGHWLSSLTRRRHGAWSRGTCGATTKMHMPQTHGRAVAISIHVLLFLLDALGCSALLHGRLEKFYASRLLLTSGVRQGGAILVLELELSACL